MPAKRTGKRRKAPKDGGRGPTEKTLDLIGPELELLGHRLQKALDKLELDQKDLAERMGVAPSTISRTSSLGIPVWRAIGMAKALGIRYEWLLLNEGPMLPSIARAPTPPPAPDVIDLRESQIPKQEGEQGTSPNELPGTNQARHKP